MSATNWWQYSKWIYNIGRTGKYLAYSESEVTAVVTFIEGMLESRAILAPRVQLKLRNPEEELAKQDSESLGGALQVIGRELKVFAATDAEKELCDALIAATDDRKNRIAVKMAGITLAADPEEGGTVTGAGRYMLTSKVQISAVPARGYEFTEWSDDNTDATREIVVSEDIELTATFAALTARTITASGDHGSVAITNEAGDTAYYDGENITLTATPSEGYKFSHWGSDTEDTNPVKTVVVDGDATYTAVFATV